MFAASTQATNCTLPLADFAARNGPNSQTTLGFSACLFDKITLRQTNPVVPRGLGLAMKHFKAHQHTPFKDLRR